MTRSWMVGLIVLGLLGTHSWKGSSAALAAESSTRIELVDFYADWCGPCRRLQPVLQRLEERFGDRLTITRVDVDAQPDIAEQFGVTALPTLALLSDGRVVRVAVGYRTEEQLVRFISGR
jgi:thioredoxin 1